jgi:hypothetical protein
MNVQLSDGLSHPNGRNIETDPFDLPARGSKSVTLSATAVAGGRQSLEARLITSGRQEAAAGAEVMVGDTGLVINLPESIRVRPNQVSELRFSIANSDAQPVRTLVITSKLPPNVEFKGASDKGGLASRFSPFTFASRTGSTVQWTIDNLNPGDSRNLSLKIRVKGHGQFVHAVNARAAGGVNAHAEGMVVSDAATQLNLSTSVKDNPVEVGRETIFEARLSNDGGSPASNVQLRVFLTQGLTLRSVLGMTRYRLEGRDLIFEPLARLEPGQAEVVSLKVAASSPGDQRCRFQLSSEQLRTPLVREERTLAYGDR